MGNLEEEGRNASSLELLFFSSGMCFALSMSVISKSHCCIYVCLLHDDWRFSFWFAVYRVYSHDI